ncbi:MAG: MipA/OmpV family protein [Beijerinckiaceae bacterium]|jgi:outer membrane protein|nr:MipA/OmpV family protein [Beijerinckiaceae bacterium]
MRLYWTAALLALASTPTVAQVDLRSDEAKAAPRNWNVTVGLGIGAAPSFLGSKNYSAAIRPVFSIGRGLGSRWLSVADDNIGFGLIEGENWRAGVAGKLLWERRESSDSALRGLGNVRFGGELGGFAEFYPLPWLRARGELRHGIIAHQALMADLKLDAFTKLADRWTISAGPRLAIAGRDFTQTYLGVDAGQSVRSGLPQFKAGAGILSYGAAAQVSYQWTPRLETSAFIQANRLAGDAAKSPLVKQRGTANQFTIGSTLRWTIDTGL